MRTKVALLVLCLWLWPASASAQVVFVKAGRVVDTDGGTVQSDQNILIRDGKIEAVGKSLAIPAGAKVVDLTSMTVLPGLIDCHTHVADPPNADPLTSLTKTSVESAFEAIPNAAKALLSGFTTVRDVGVYRALTDVAMRDAIARGDIVGPRMYVAGAYITITGGAGAMTGVAPDIKLPLDLRYGEANSPWEVRQRIRDLVSQRVDLIKVLSTGAVLTHNSNPRSDEFTPEELQAHSPTGIKNAIRAGVASIEHATLIDDEGIALAKQRGTYLDMDIYDEECIQAKGLQNAIPKDFLEHDAQLGAIQRENFRKAVRAGVKMAFGTDAGVCPHGIAARQFAFMVNYGMTPMQAIQSATSAAADLLGHANELGSIKTGKWADLIAVNGDPLNDIRVLENVKFVMKAGMIYKQ
ncbi:MAG: hypothetical protein AUI85_13230 [Acidobacteriales bacterium 13_1_40CM_3_55_5]|nr:MAG: hypothetical protein AUI85_13230 [Acidobacteriales bacterium 13_1_40CM_3_55_5]